MCAERHTSSGMRERCDRIARHSRDLSKSAGNWGRFRSSTSCPASTAPEPAVAGGVKAQGGRNETLAWAQPGIAARPLPCGLEKARAVRIDRLRPSWEHPAVPGAATEEG